MSVFILSFVLIVLAVAAMSIGVLFGRPPVSGSCGGVGTGGDCGLCTRRCSRKDRRNQAH